jgi:hypothetical protein
METDTVSLYQESRPREDAKQTQLGSLSMESRRDHDAKHTVSHSYTGCQYSRSVVVSRPCEDNTDTQR